MREGFIPKAVKWLLGDKIASSLVGIVIGAAGGVATVAATGNVSTNALVIGGIGGASSALLGAGGRGKGEQSK